MTRDEIRELLTAYKANKSRVAYLQAELKKSEREYEQMRFDVKDALVSPKAQVITDMPHGTGISNPTERYGIKLAEGAADEDVIRLLSKVYGIERQLSALEAKCEYVEAWLEGLPEREKFVIEHKMIGEEYWSEVAAGYAARYGYEVSRATLKRFREQGISRIMQVVNCA